MHKYLVLRGNKNLIRRAVEDLMQVYLPFKTKKGKDIGMLQLMPREIKTYELVFPATSKKEIKKIVEDIVSKHNGPLGGIGLHWGPSKRDKWAKNKKGDEIEML